jgi:hypothetical protein
MQEFICPNGRMSVNGVCPIFEGGDGQIRDYQTPKTFNQKYESIEDIPITQGTTPKTDTSLKSPEIIDTKSLVDQYKSKEISSSPIDRIIDSVNTTLSPMVDKVTQPVKDTVSKVPKGFFKFDFEKDTESKNDNANNIINKNINYYNNFVENKLGIPSNVQNALRFGTTAASILGGGSLISVAAPWAIPFILGGALRGKEENRIQNITNQDTQGTINRVVSPRIMNIQPTAQDIYRGGGQGQYSGGTTKSSSGSKSGGFNSAERGAALHG